jgi:hypothetical protein
MRMKMKRKYVMRRRAVAIAILMLLVSLFTYTTRDLCYVGNMPGNTFGYGSCSKMIDLVVTP